jgi:hypothetical protein
MQAKTRRSVDMGERVSSYAHANPVPNATFLGLLAQMDGLLERARVAAAEQRDGIAQSRGATARKDAIHSEIRRIYLPHIDTVADQAMSEQPEIQPALRAGPDSHTVRGFRTAAGAIAAAVGTHRELLVRHGLSDEIADGLGPKLKEFDQAVAQGLEGRRRHVAATAELMILAAEIVDVVRVMDGFERLRFAQDPERLAAWTSASSLTAAPVVRDTPSDGQPEGGASAEGGVRPAA